MKFTRIEYLIFSTLIILIGLVLYNLNKEEEEEHQNKSNIILKKSDCGCNKTL